MGKALSFNARDRGFESLLRILTFFFLFCLVGKELMEFSSVHVLYFNLLMLFENMYFTPHYGNILNTYVTANMKRGLIRFFENFELYI